MKTNEVDMFIIGLYVGLFAAVIIQALANRPITDKKIIDGVVCVKVIPNRVASVVTVPCK